MYGFYRHCRTWPHQQWTRSWTGPSERERALVEMLKTRTPLLETYLQDLKFDPEVGPSPLQDHYFLGRMMPLEMAPFFSLA